MNKKNSEGLRILMAEGVSQPHTEATPGEILRCAQDDTMADDGTQPGTGATEAADETTNRVDEEDTAKTAQQPTTTEDGSTTPSTVIWTPRFMVIFALTLAMGLSAESVLTQGWTSHYYAGQWVLMGHVAVIFACFIE